MAANEILVTARWRAEILEWSRSWPESGFVMPSGRKRSAFRLLKACMALAGMARADGSLKGQHADYWTREQLSRPMQMSRKAAGDTLAWLELNARLVSHRGGLTTEGREPDSRRLVVFQASGSQENSGVTLSAGSQEPSLGVTNGVPRGHATLEPEGHAELDSDPSPLVPLLSLPSLAVRKERSRRLREQIAELAAAKAL